MKQEDAKIIAILGVTTAVIVGGFLVGKQLLEFLGLKDDKDDKKKAAEQAAIVVDIAADIQKAKNAGQTSSYLESTYKNVANNIHEATRYDALGDKNKIAVDALIKYTPKDIDYLKLQQAYGSRAHHWFGIERAPRTLSECLSQELTQKEKDRVNKTWAGRKMTSRL